MKPDKCTGWAIVATMERPDGTWYTDTITEIDDDTASTVDTFLTLRFRKEPMMMYDDTLDVAVEVIQDFLNCDPMDIGKLQSNTYNTIYNIEKEIDESNS